MKNGCAKTIVKKSSAASRKPVNLAILDVNRRGRGFLEDGTPYLKAGLQIMTFCTSLRPRYNFSLFSIACWWGLQTNWQEYFFPSAPCSLSPAYKVIVLQYGTNYSLKCWIKW